MSMLMILFFLSSRRRHTRSYGDWSSDVCSSDLLAGPELGGVYEQAHDHHVTALAGGVEERQVAFVQVTHGRHKADRSTLAAGGLQGVAELGLGADGPHAA